MLLEYLIFLGHCVTKWGNEETFFLVVQEKKTH